MKQLKKAGPTGEIVRREYRVSLVVEQVTVFENGHEIVGDVPASETLRTTNQLDKAMDTFNRIANTASLLR